MKNTIQLYGCLICPYVQRVRTTLEYLNLDYAYVEKDLLTGKNKQSDYLKIVPSGQIPAIILND